MYIYVVNQQPFLSLRLNTSGILTYRPIRTANVNLARNSSSPRFHCSRETQHYWMKRLSSRSNDSFSSCCWPRSYKKTVQWWVLLRYVSGNLCYYAVYSLKHALISRWASRLSAVLSAGRLSVRATGRTHFIWSLSCCCATVRMHVFLWYTLNLTFTMSSYVVRNTPVYNE